MNHPTETGTGGATPVSRRSLLKSAAALGVAAPSAALLSNPSLAGESAMTAHQAAEVVRRAYHAFNSADLALFDTLSTEDMSWETPGTSPIAGKREGRPSVYEQYGTYLSGTDGTFKAELQYVTADDEGRVIGVHRNTGMRNGNALDTMCCITFEVADGKIRSGKEHFFDLYNWDRFWA